MQQRQEHGRPSDALDPVGTGGEADAPVHSEGESEYCECDHRVNGPVEAVPERGEQDEEDLQERYPDDGIHCLPGLHVQAMSLMRYKFARRRQTDAPPVPQMTGERRHFPCGRKLRNDFNRVN